jgi:hypothetical protein
MPTKHEERCPHCAASMYELTGTCHCGRRPWKAHKIDDDAVCTRCGWDGAEWHHWKHNTWEGRASDKVEPPCSG